MRKKNADIVKKERCETCAHYRQHYVKHQGTGDWVAISYGHCTFPRLKTREPDQHCDYWEQREDPPDNPTEWEDPSELACEEEEDDIDWDVGR